jgi:ribosomal protein S18 acetylase RimI-like enzyme
MESDRLTYAPVTEARLDDFHRLVQDEHVRRYLMDGQVLPREWSEGFDTIVAGVDEVNAASLRVLEKLGFRKAATLPGSFGNMYVLTLGMITRRRPPRRRPC